jgi:hypothetical protein
MPSNDYGDAGGAGGGAGYGANGRAVQVDSFKTLIQSAYGFSA